MITQLAAAVDDAICEGMAIAQDQKTMVIESIEDALADFFDINLADYDMVRDILNEMDLCDLSLIYSLMTGSPSPLATIAGCGSKLDVSTRMAYSALESAHEKLHRLILERLADAILAANPPMASAVFEHQTSQ